MLKLSIIIPVYQVEPYIRSCLESVFKQGLDDGDFEVIIVNDGTKDRSMEMIADIIGRHDNITVANQANQGLSVARNHGISLAKGEYILMPDSDDLLIENSIKPLLDMALKTQVDLVVADFLEMNDSEIEAYKGTVQTDIAFEEKSGECLFLEDLNPFQCFVWRTLFRRRFIIDNHLAFFPGIRYQDVPFTHECYLKAERCLRTHWLLNIYRKGHPSATSRFSMSNAHDFCYGISETWKLAKLPALTAGMDHKLREDVYTSFSMMVYSTLHSVLDKADRRAVIDLMLQLAPDLCFNHGIKQKAETFLFRHTPHFYMTLREWHWRWIRRHAQTKR